MISLREKRILEKNRRRFDALVHALDSLSIKMDEALLARIQRAVNFAVQNDTGCFCSPEIEAKLCKIAQSLPDHNEKSPLPPGTILHVMTTAYRSGGHTRVVERWIANSPPEENHSVVLINQEPMHFPFLLEDIVTARGGRLLQLPPVPQTEKGSILRSLSSGAAKIVLHVHMYDPVPILAYGTSSFTIPVIFFNHADHLFWIGVSIADLCADMSLWRCAFSLRRRGITNVGFLPIPIDERFPPLSRDEARRTLGIYSRSSSDRYHGPGIQVQLLPGTSIFFLFFYGLQPNTQNGSSLQSGHHRPIRYGSSYRVPRLGEFALVERFPMRRSGFTCTPQISTLRVFPSHPSHPFSMWRISAFQLFHCGFRCHISTPLRRRGQSARPSMTSVTVLTPLSLTLPPPPS